MELKGIDVSSYQGKPDWKKVKADGISYAILRITERYGIDSSFEHNLSGCKANGIRVGVYKFSYALSIAEIKKEAEAVIETLTGRGLDFPIWLDLEWEKQRNLSKDTLSAMIKTFRAVVVAAGYKFGIYCNVDWYNNVLPDDCKTYDFWLARYPSNDTGVVQERLRPSTGVGWQYSSKGKVNGIDGNVDMDVFYTDYSDKKEENTVDLWTKTKELLDAQVGYLEKASNYNLDSKTGNAGYRNYTKYSRDVNELGLTGYQGQPWCATYQFWICAMIIRKEKALEIMGSGFYNCNSVKAHAKAAGTWHSTPKLGALVIFRNGAHIGRVVEISGNTIRTNEGNTSAGTVNTVEANGGMVAEKEYTIGASVIDGYVWIDYGVEVDQIFSDTETWTVTGTATSTVDNLYVRAEPNGEILGEINTGNRVEINGVTSGKWTQVKVAGIGIGWCWTGYLQKDGATEQKATEITNKQDKTKRLFVGKVTATALNVRTWAGAAFPKIKSYPVLNYGNLVDVMNYTQKSDDGVEWYYVRIAGLYHGFVSSKYIQKM